MFPKFYQPDPSVGAVLVHSQDEVDALVAKGWPSKFKDQAPAKDDKTEALLARIAALEAQIAASSAAGAAPSTTPVAPPSPAPSPAPAPVATPVPTPVAASSAPAPKK